MQSFFMRFIWSIKRKNRGFWLTCLWTLSISERYLCRRSFFIVTRSSWSSICDRKLTDGGEALAEAAAEAARAATARKSPSTWETVRLLPLIVDAGGAVAFEGRSTGGGRRTVKLPDKLLLFAIFVLLLLLFWFFDSLEPMTLEKPVEKFSICK